jgi:hypothetical protein
MEILASGLDRFGNNRVPGPLKGNDSLLLAFITRFICHGGSPLGRPIIGQQGGFRLGHPWRLEHLHRHAFPGAIFSWSDG